jgi:site-specific DNA-methyltransferase (adenine-specific)/adenine-specific DNA-methyltransferase
MAEEEKYEQLDIFELRKPVIKGFPQLRWTGKRAFESTQFFPAQLKEKYGEPGENGWMNKIFWGDNLQVMSHLLKDFRSKINLIYIDPPFDSKADYKKTISIRGKSIQNDNNTFEEKQYGDIWTNDDYLQFMFERLMLMQELLTDDGVICVHCDYRKAAHIKLIMDEIFGPDCFVNEIIWCRTSSSSAKASSEYATSFLRAHDNIFIYTKSPSLFKGVRKNKYTSIEYSDRVKNSLGVDENGNAFYKRGKGTIGGREIAAEVEVNVEQGMLARSWWTDIPILRHNSADNVNYPTQKPEKLLERIIGAFSDEGDLVFDCFMGSGTTQAVAMRLGRRFIGADINLGAVQTASKRLIEQLVETNILKNSCGFEVYNVNNYDFFRNPIEARDLLIEALNIQPFSSSNVFDGELDGRHVKILPVNRIATKADLGDLVANLPYKEYEKKKENDPNETVDRITLVCMGHEPDLKAGFEQMVGTFKIDIEIVDILRDKSALEFKREATANVELKHDELVIKEFYPMNLLQKLSLQKENVEEWRQLVDSIMIDYNYDGETLNPQIMDIPEKNDLVKGRYSIPKNHGRIKVKITDLLSESLEVEVK